MPAFEASALLEKHGLAAVLATIFAIALDAHYRFFSNICILNIQKNAIIGLANIVAADKQAYDGHADHKPD